MSTIHDIDPTECVELLRSQRLVCKSGNHNKDYQGVFAIHPETKEVVSWVEWGRIRELSDSQYKKQFKVHYVGADVEDAINPIETMLNRKSKGKGTSTYTLPSGQSPNWADLTVSKTSLRAAIAQWEKEHSTSYVQRPRKRMRAGNVLVPFAQRASMTRS